MPSVDPLTLTSSLGGSDPPGHPRAARPWRRDGERIGCSVRHQPARRLEAPQGARDRRADLAGREAQWRPCRLEAGPLKEVDHWLGRYRRLWEESFDRMDAYLAQITKENGDERKS